MLYEIRNEKRKAIRKDTITSKILKMGSILANILKSRLNRSANIQFLKECRGDLVIQKAGLNFHTSLRRYLKNQTVIILKVTKSSELY